MAYKNSQVRRERLINAAYCVSLAYRNGETLERFLARERNRVHNANRRTRDYGKLPTLTFVEWLELIVKYRGFCAYCSQQFYESLEHVIPLSEGGDTTRHNVLPVCTECNDRRAKMRYWTKERYQVIAKP